MKKLMLMTAVAAMVAVAGHAATRTWNPTVLASDSKYYWNNADNYAVYVMPVDLIFGDSMYYGMMNEAEALSEPYYDEVIRHILVDLGYTDEQATDILLGCFAFEQDIAEHIFTTEE